MIAIKNFEMPKDCSVCPMCHPKGKDEPWNYCCFLTMKDIDLNQWETVRCDNCPLVDIEFGYRKEDAGDFQSGYNLALDEIKEQLL